MGPEDACTACTTTNVCERCAHHERCGFGLTDADEDFE